LTEDEGFILPLSLYGERESWEREEMEWVLLAGGRYVR
jgi:hypothetical protein